MSFIILFFFQYVAGAKDGTLLTMGIDKVHPSSPWTATVELASEDDEVDGVDDEPVSIIKLIWMAPQPPSVEGCLFALLGCPGSDNDSLKSVVVGLSPMGTHGTQYIAKLLFFLHLLLQHFLHYLFFFSSYNLTPL